MTSTKKLNSINKNFFQVKIFQNLMESQYLEVFANISLLKNLWKTLFFVFRKLKSFFQRLKEYC